MKAFSNAKREERKEKKKKKLLALANLVQLNDIDRREEALTQPATKATGQDPDANNDDGFTKVTHKKKSKHLKPHTKLPEELPETQPSPSAAPAEDEPQNKRAKLNNTESTDEATNSDATTLSTADENQRTMLQLTEEQYKQLRLQLRQRKREIENVPALRLRECGQRAALEIPQDKRTPLFLTDIQHLLMTALIGKKSPCLPDRWCVLEKPLRLSHSVVLILEGLSLYHYLSNESKFEQVNKIFETRLEIVLPPPKVGSIVEEIAQVPLTNVQAHKLIEEHGSLESAVEMTKDPTLLVKAIFPVSDEAAETPKNKLPTGEKFPRTKLLLSALQMVDEGYPMPLRGELSERFKNYVFTKDKYAPVTDQSPMFGVDCEMCRTAVGYNELTRLSIVNEQFETVYETLVMPTNKIIDYLTPYSGITAEIMQTVTKNIKDVQEEVRALLPPDAILVGQSLNFDLNAMKMMHPYVIDTSMCFNLSGIRRRKAKLQTLAMTFLKESIQENAFGHDSVEDSLASLKLVKKKLEHSLEYGDEILMQKKRLHDIMRLAQGDSIKNNLLAHASQRDKRTAIISNGALQQQMRDIIVKAEEQNERDSLKSVSLFELDNNKRAINKAREVALEHSLTITNLRFFVEDFHLDNADKTVQKLDKWIDKLWQTVAHNGLFLVLMGGSEECPSGLAKIAIKRMAHAAAAEVAATTPITL